MSDHGMGDNMGVFVAGTAQPKDKAVDDLHAAETCAV
jgi:hypothetical protein